MPTELQYRVYQSLDKIIAYLLATDPPPGVTLTEEARRKLLELAEGEGYRLSSLIDNLSKSAYSLDVRKTLGSENYELIYFTDFWGMTYNVLDKRLDIGTALTEFLAIRRLLVSLGWNTAPQSDFEDQA